MIRINLLPFRAARTKENVRRQISVFILLILLMLVAMVAITIRLNIEKTETQQKVTAVTNELSGYTKQAKEVDKLRKEGENLQKKIDIITKLEDVRKEPVVIFTALTDVMVADRMSLSGFNTKEDTLTLKGTALDEITVADFTKRLETSDVFIDVDLKFLKHGTINKVAVKNFEVSCKIGKTKKDLIPVTGKAVK